MRKTFHTVLQAGADVLSPIDRRVGVAGIVILFAACTLLVLSPNRVKKAMSWSNKRRVVMSPRAVLAYRIVAMFFALIALWDMYWILRLP